MSMRSRFLLALAVALVPLACQPARPRTNVVLISIDCLNERQLAQAIGDASAPNLAALASESLVFTRAYAHAPWTTPSHMSMLTGLYPSEHGRDIPVSIAAQYGKLGERVSTYETLADRLSAVGYETVAFVGKGSISAEYGLAQGFSAYNEAPQKNTEQSDLVKSEPALEDWLRRRGPEPFFLFFHTYDLHYPLPPSRSSDADAIRYIDGFLGRLFSRLRQANQYDSTLVFVTGDHGSSMLHVEGKCCLHGAGHYEENLRVPLLLKLPKANERGRKDVLVRHIDILPTVLDVLDMPTGSYKGEGTSILDRLDGTGGDLASFSEADARCVSRQAIVTRRYKYIYTPQDPLRQLLNSNSMFYDPLCAAKPDCTGVPLEELYDLESDPYEERDLLGTQLAPEVANALRHLRADLERHRNLPRSYRLATLTRDIERGPTPEIDESTKEALRALGYIH